MVEPQNPEVSHDPGGTRWKRDGRKARSGQDPDDQSAPLIAFVHIPKTAGGTLKSMFIDAFGRNAQHNSGNYLKNPERTADTLRINPWIRVTIGHVHYGLLREHLPAETRYITFLREPVDRVVSHYYRHFDGGQAGSLREALERGMPDLTNLMTRFLCGHVDILGELPESALDDAKASLERFAFVGFQERFDESLLLLQERLGVPKTAYGENRHVNDERPSMEELADDERALIARHNRLDVELYAWARARFDTDLASRPGDLAAEVEELRRESAAKAAEEARRTHLAAEWLRSALPPGTSRPIDQLAAEAEAAGIHRRELNRAKRALKPNCRNLFTDSGVHWMMRSADGTVDDDAIARAAMTTSAEHRARKKERKKRRHALREAANVSTSPDD